MRGQSSKIGTPRPKNGTAPAAGVLDDLAVFVSVARLGSFVEASRRLAIPTSTVSRAVARLEENLGVSLLRRTSRTVTTTDEGRALVARSAAHLDGLDEALVTVSDRDAEPSGVVRVTAPAFTGATRVARALGAFASAYPKIAIELDATNMIRDLLQDGFDFGIRVGPQASPDFVAKRLWQGRFGLFATREVAARFTRAKGRLSREALERAPCVALRPAATWRFRDASGVATAVTPTIRFAVNDPRAAVDLAREGIGIALAPVDAVAKGDRGLVRLETDFGEPEPVDLYVVYPSARLLARRVRMAIDWLANSP